MAYADYTHCEICDAKAFYDANLNWGDPEPDPNIALNQALDNCGDMKALCLKCARSYKLVVERK